MPAAAGRQASYAPLALDRPPLPVAWRAAATPGVAPGGARRAVQGRPAGFRRNRRVRRESIRGR